jgi:pSer/pThr/pTyr-binding forkhead associated (FHA) protein
MTLPTPTDRHTVSPGQTEDVEAIDRPRDGTDASEALRTPGRHLLVQQGGETRRFTLTHQVTHLGRGFAATLQLEDRGVSRRHAIVVQRRSGVRILDDRSANGTWVNGRRVHEAELHDGDVIVLGRVVLVLSELPAQAA